MNRYKILKNRELETVTSEQADEIFIQEEMKKISEIISVEIRKLISGTIGTPNDWDQESKILSSGINHITERIFLRHL
jgi:hypothetical protein